MARMTQRLTLAEQVALDTHEYTIERGLKTFYAVGSALAEIRDGRLYRVSHESFEAYCQERWSLNRNRAYQLMDAAGVVESMQMSTMVDIPQNERQARALIQVDPDLRSAVMHEAIETAPNGQVTAAHIEKVAASHTAEPASQQNVHFSSESKEWYTPPKIIERVLMIFDEIDLDPCSNSKTKPNVPARQLYTKEDDGLAHDWHGRVYMNPPYGDVIDAWISKLIVEYQAGHVDTAIALIPSRTDTDWFWPVWRYPICFVHGRLKFITPDGTNGSAPFASAIAYLGDDVRSFARWFGDLGHIVGMNDGNT